MKKWFKVSHGNGKTSVTCTVNEDGLTVKWTVKCYTSTIKEGAREAEKAALEALSELKEVTG